MKLKLLGCLNNVPVYALSLETNDAFVKCDAYDLHKKFPDIFPESLMCPFQIKYRAVSLERWPRIKKNGVDVVPTDAEIYCDSLDKAMEYADWPKILMGFDGEHLEKTFREVDANIDSNELSELIKTYRTQEPIDGNRIWLSRLALDDPRRTSGYEIAYAYWIPNSPWDALKVLILADLYEREWDMQTNEDHTIS